MPTVNAAGNAAAAGALLQATAVPCPPRYAMLPRKGPSAAGSPNSRAEAMPMKFWPAMASSTARQITSAPLPADASRPRCAPKPSDAKKTSSSASRGAIANLRSRTSAARSPARASESTRPALTAGGTLLRSSKGTSRLRRRPSAIASSAATSVDSPSSECTGIAIALTRP